MGRQYGRHRIFGSDRLGIRGSDPLTKGLRDRAELHPSQRPLARGALAKSVAKDRWTIIIVPVMAKKRVAPVTLPSSAPRIFSAAR